ncbi:hypothetical protein Scep_011993 [Stephania cephalantha]|uniref:Uncharacterized protein n=1 Tax=Stephania cephalantha TaxID=152367 RepID=A0AAP0JGB6_9MAGN
MTTRVLNVKIVGDLKAKKKVAVQGDVIDGNEKASTVEFFITCIQDFDIVNDLIHIRHSQIEKEFQLPVKAIGYYLVAKYITADVAGKFGIPVYTVSDNLVQETERKETQEENRMLNKSLQEHGSRLEKLEDIVIQAIGKTLPTFNNELNEDET